LLSDDRLEFRSNIAEEDQSEYAVMKEDMLSNALVWLSSQLCNFIAAREWFNPVLVGDRSETPREDEPGEFGKSHTSLLLSDEGDFAMNSSYGSKAFR